MTSELKAMRRDPDARSGRASPGGLMQITPRLYRLIAVVVGTMVLSLTTAAPLRAPTIVAPTDVLGGYDSIGTSSVGGVRASEAAWSQTSSFANVSIAAEIDPDHNLLPITSHTVSGTAFLMTQVGPGTTAANQIASTPFTVTGTAFSPTLVTLFTGLTLGPGTYHLVLSAPADQSAGWDFVLFPSTACTAPGVTLGNGNLSGIEAGYPQATNFSDLFDNLLEFSVTGGAVATPGPSTILLLSAGLLAMAARGRIPRLGKRMHKRHRACR